MNTIPPGFDSLLTIGVTKPVLRLVWPIKAPIWVFPVGSLNVSIAEYVATGLSG